MTGTTRLTFRGTGDSQGVPRVYCECAVCSEARISHVNRRHRCALQIEDPDAGMLWIDCGPDWGRQMEAAGLRSIDSMFITHAHFDHIGGLSEWYDICRWTGKKGEAYSPSEVIEEINQRLPWLTSQIHFQAFDSPIDIGNWKVTSWRVNHGKNGYAYAFRFAHRISGKCWVYCSDAIGLTEEQQKPMLGADLIILGTSFYKEPYAYDTRSVYDVEEALLLAQKWRPKRMILTHMSHDIDVRQNEALPDGVEYAKTGMTVII